MKLSVSLSAILALLPALAAASSPLDARGLNGDMYMPRHHARNFGRQRQGAFGGGNGRFGQGNRGSSGAKTTTTAAAAASNKNKSKSSTSVAAPVAATTTAAVVANAASTSTAAATVAANKNKNKGNKSSTTDAATAASTTAAAAASTTDAAASVAATTTSAAGAAASVADNNPNTSLTLSSNLVETGLENDGQNPPVAGQVASLTSKNNFINFCAGKTITNGQQITGGSCNPIPMGDIIPKANMPSCKFKNPKNFSTIPANTAFTIDMALNNLQAGTFTNAQKTYYMAPQQLNGQGVLIGHTHFVIQAMGNLADGSILDPATFTFFKGVNTGQVNGVVSADVTAGVPPGNYRLASINTDANHTPAVGAVAQHGWFDDIIYFTAQ